METFLKSLARFENKYYSIILVVLLALTIFMGVGVTKIKVQSDMSASFPQDLDIFKTGDRVTEKFGGQDAILVLIEIDENYADEISVKDIRDPEVMKFLMNLENSLKVKSDFEVVQSAGTVFNMFGEPRNLDESKGILSQIPEADSFFSRDYTKTMLFIGADLGSGPAKLKSIEKDVLDEVNGAGLPKGLKVTVTGTPSITNLILKLLVSDGAKTLMVSALIIFLLIFVLQRSLAKALIVFLPLLVGVIWTMGTMGWLGIELSMATAGIGTMVLGLGVEYSIFLFTRYHEEKGKNKKSRIDALETSIHAVGSSILGSSTTTIIGFLALTISIMPLMQSLGLSLAIGIFYCLFMTLFLTPPLLVFEEEFMEKRDRKNYERLTKKYGEINKKKEKKNGK